MRSPNCSRPHALRRGAGTVAVLVVATVLSPVAMPVAAASAPSTHVVASRDGIVLRSQIVGEQTRLVRVSPDPAQLLILDRPLELRAVEPGGRRAVLADPLPTGATPFRPGGRASTTLVVADLVNRTSRTYVLSHNVEPEAFGVGSPLLYLIDHRPKLDPDSYRVAALDLDTGVAQKVFGPLSTKVPLDDMTASARQQVPAPSGRQLYTLYVETARTSGESSEYREYGSSSTDGWTSAFVHVLDLAENWAYCVNLPAEFGLGAPSGNAIAVSPDGKRLFIADAHAGSLAMLDATRLTRDSLIARAPSVTQVPLPTAVGARDHVELAATATAVTLTDHGATWTFDVTAATWLQG
jgi:hypothetical protein